MGKRRARVKWEAGDGFVVPLTDGTGCAGQVVGREPGR